MPSPTPDPQPLPQARAMSPDGSGEISPDLAALRRRIAGLERFSTAGNAPGQAAVAAVALGAAEIDAHLPWGGLVRGALHQVTYPSPGPIPGEAAAAGFAAALLGRLAEDGARSVVWCRRPARGFRPGIYGAGLRHLGLPPERLILAQAPDAQSVLWVMEECLRSRAVAAVLGEPDRADARAQRRLQLAAEDTGVTALLLMDARAAAGPGPAVTRWHVAGAPAVRGAAWRVELLKCRGGGRPGDWTLEWQPRNDGDDDGNADLPDDNRDGNRDGERNGNGEPAGGFRVVSPFRDGPARRRTG